MARRPANRFICQSCGAVFPKWSGRCDACGAWNSIVEETVEPAAGGGTNARRRSGARINLVGLAGDTPPPPRIETRIGELDRVLGGGLVPASVVLVGGDPGIGKSTLLLQGACALARAGRKVMYISGEEAVDQIRLRARRLGLEAPTLELAAAINVADIVATLEAEKDLALVVIDSIQTMWMETVESAPGTVSQVRACAFELIRLAKQRGFSLILVGHVTKEGALAGPRVLEHMVDAVMYFEGDRGHQFRILRAAKNRFGATDEIGVFAMTDQGLEEVPNPSALFLAERRGHIAGSAVFAGMEGTRPVLLEVQALLSPKAGDGGARRAVVGWDTGRLNMLLAVLEARCGIKLNAMDVHLNIAGGLRVGEPAADMAVAAALVSAATGQPTSAGSVYFGEVGLSGEIRQVSQPDTRLKEAHKLGFEHAFLPRRIARGNRRPTAPDGLGIQEIGHLGDLVSLFTGAMEEAAG
ncbi:DNA repair protein RadA [Komagataeibacter rhaeticus]|uniref:DNA repair protein RadA n=1 Tax=Komagataeibacter rhaeticus TaxID=215221 RepID=UPI0004D87C59|nr:DNA repair protein RadA [Komagataeibacter rhaeticus]KDU97597.1 DNA repair protein RadA [Komagataeibacter rhaeticus AF1]MBL7240884.1 DNA repair protein RadA [Komagataeibacter rhaeticus]PYD54876.1 DNA repair protein RadA [Komagataeibacter rhaeticus]GBQ12561.1 DNA repair protein RadA [Komagataeibacter rhaeticus DSM 16663]